MPVQDGNDKGHWLAGPAQPLEPNVHLHGVARFAIPNYLDSFLQAHKIFFHEMLLHGQCAIWYNDK